jgi:hypothetical protein
LQIFAIINPILLTFKTLKMSDNPSPVPDKGWAVKGNTRDSKKPEQKFDLQIPEVNPCIKMPVLKQTVFGSPIDANLAVDFICNFYKLFRVTPVPQPGKPFEKIIDNMNEAELKESLSNAHQIHTQLAKLNYGMTMDKNMLLKFLSQPGCEGIRFYLCSESQPQNHISLVAVGVDGCGCDLNFDIKKCVHKPFPNKKNKASSPGEFTVDLASLTGQYVTPPGGGGIEDKNKAISSHDVDDSFVLLNIAKKYGHAHIPSFEDL